MYFSCHGRLPITPFDPRGVHGHALLSASVDQASSQRSTQISSRKGLLE